MTMNDKITLVIHSRERAEALQGILECHGVEVELEVLKITQTDDCDLFRVNVPAAKLPLALKLMESGETLSLSQLDMKMAGVSGNLLIPVDFSPSSSIAVSAGFRLAMLLNIRPVLLHAYYTPPIPNAVAPFGNINGEEDALVAAEDSADIRQIAESQMNRFKAEIRREQVDGNIPSVSFSSIVADGVAEEVIQAYCKRNMPMLVVMATRGFNKKGEDLIGSVAAEVIDTCRVPVLTVPEDIKPEAGMELKRVLLACSLDRSDLVAMQAVMQTFDFPDCTVYMVPVVDRPKSSAAVKKLNDLRAYFASVFPLAKFECHILDEKAFKQSLDKFVHSKKVDLMIVPNKRTNVFRRIFKPSLAHKCLFERDLPLLAIPV